MKKVKDMKDDELCEDLMEWFRIGRNEGMLKGEERRYFQEICKEIKSRGLLKRKNLVQLVKGN